MAQHFDVLPFLNLNSQNLTVNISNSLNLIKDKNSLSENDILSKTQHLEWVFHLLLIKNFLKKDNSKKIKQCYNSYVNQNKGNNFKLNLIPVGVNLCELHITGVKQGFVTEYFDNYNDNISNEDKTGINIIIKSFSNEILKNSKNDFINLLTEEMKNYYTLISPKEQNNLIKKFVKDFNFNQYYSIELCYQIQLNNMKPTITLVSSFIVS